MVAEQLDVARLKNAVQSQSAAGGQAGEQLHGRMVSRGEAGHFWMPL